MQTSRLYAPSQRDLEGMGRELFVAIHQMMKRAQLEPCSLEDMVYWAYPGHEGACTVAAQMLLAKGYTGIDISLLWPVSMDKVNATLENLRFGNQGD